MLTSRLKKLEELLAVKKEKKYPIMIVEGDYRFDDKNEENRFIDYIRINNPTTFVIEITKEDVKKWRNENK